MSKRGQSRRKWGSRLPSRSVAPGFRNFCITNEGDFFADTRTSSREEDKKVPIASDEKPSTSRESSHEPDTISICTTSSDEEYTKAAEAPKVIERVLERCKSLGVKVPLPSRRSVITISSSSEDDEDVVILSMPETERKSSTPLPAPKPGDEEPFFLCCHKKFNYKSRIERHCKDEEENNNHFCFSSVAIKEEPADKPAAGFLSVDALKLSPYISRDEAEQRLNSLQSVTETQREIDDISAIITSGKVFRTTRTFMQTELKEQLQEKSQNAPSKSSLVKVPLDLPKVPVPDPGKQYVSSHASLTLGNGGRVIRPAMQQLKRPSAASLKDITKEATNPETKCNAGGGYFLLRSPSASAGEDYEWISD